jgi:hypothetical protein
MIRRTTRLFVKIFTAAGLLALASNGHAGPSTVPPALAACSKALIETLAKSESLPSYTVKPPSTIVSDIIDPNAYTVIAKHRKTDKLLAKASCRATSAGEILSFKAIPLKS